MKERTERYIEVKIEESRRYFDSEIASIRRAVDKYSDTNDEWKSLHNGLQRSMEKERQEFMRKDESGRLIQILVAIGMFVLGIAIYLKK